MNGNRVLGAGRGTRLEVLERIKRSPGGVGVKDLSASMAMSYMGIKAHCIALATEGFLETWRSPSPEGAKGRPRLLYRLTPRGERFFRGDDGGLASALLRQAAALFGGAAPGKLLVMHFRSETERYRSLVVGEHLGERLRSFVRIRDKEGRMSALREGEVWEIRECHLPLAAMMEEFPELRRQEEHLVGEVLGVPVIRTEAQGVVVFTPAGRGA